MVDEGYWSAALRTTIHWVGMIFMLNLQNRNAAMMTIGTWTFQATENGFKDISDDWDWARPFPNLTMEVSYLFLLALELPCQ